MLQAQIFIDKDDLIGLKPLYQYTLEFLMKHGIKGATVFKGVGGFGPNHRLKYPNDLFSFDDVPMVITFIDQKEHVEKVLTALRNETKAGLIITSQVEQW